jgi:hypothetical protein
VFVWVSFCVDALFDGYTVTMVSRVVKMKVIAIIRRGGGSQLSIPCTQGSTSC